MPAVETPTPEQLLHASLVLEGAAWNRHQQASAMGIGTHRERKVFERERDDLRLVADWLEAEARRMHVP